MAQCLYELISLILVDLLFEQFCFLAVTVDLSHNIFYCQFSIQIVQFIIQNQLTMTDLEYTPSIHFHFEDTNKRSDASHIFDLSNTHQKPRMAMPMTDNKKIEREKEQEEQEEEEEEERGVSKLKTEQFFQEFDKKFIVTFEGEDKRSGEGQRESRNPEQQHTEEQSPSKISFIQPRAKSLLQTQVSGLSLEPAKRFSEKEKNSPIPSFEVKKRTVFKSKQQLQQTNHMFKITKKKIYNRKNMEVIDQIKSCKMPQKDTEKDKENSLYLSLKVWKPIETDNDHPAQKKSKSSIFQNDNAKQLREQMRGSLRGNTFDFWRRKFERKNEEETVRRQNIFRMIR